MCKDKATLTLFKSVFTKETNTLPAFEVVYDPNIIENVFLKDKVKNKLLNLNPYKLPRADNLHPRTLKELSVSLSVLCSYFLH